jgi:nitrite reductase/ring-hydroxylating ferredoxin subunit
MDSKLQWIALPIEKSQLNEQLPPGKLCRIRINNFFLCLAHTTQGNVYAIEDNCPHRGAPLHQGRLNDYEEIICPLHDYRFDLRTGRAAQHYFGCSDALVFPLKWQAGQLYVGLPEKLLDK